MGQVMPHITIAVSGKLLCSQVVQAAAGQETEHTNQWPRLSTLGHARHPLRNRQFLAALHDTSRDSEPGGFPAGHVFPQHARRILKRSRVRCIKPFLQYSEQLMDSIRHAQRGIGAGSGAGVNDIRAYG